MLVNLWATWCAPCVKELPTLDALSQRTTATARSAWSRSARTWGRIRRSWRSCEAHKIARPRSLSGSEDGACPARSGAEVLPTSILFDAKGNEVWRYVGDLDWTSAEAAKLLAEAGAAQPSALTSRPSIAARPSAIRPSPSEVLRRKLLAEEQAAEQDRDGRNQQGHEQRVGRAGAVDQAEIEDVAEGGAEQRQRGDRRRSR